MLLTGTHAELLQTVKGVFNYLDLGKDLIPSNDVVIRNLKKRFNVCDYVWENLDSFLTCLARDCSRSYHGLSSDDFEEYLEAERRTIAVLYDSQCQIESQSNLA